MLDLFDLLADLGYLALVADHDLPAQGRPHRKPLSKKHSHPVLTNTQRAENSVQAHPRVKVGHVLSGAKRMGCVAQTCRNKSTSLTDRPSPSLRNLERAFEKAKRPHLGTSLVSPA